MKVKLTPGSILRYNEYMKILLCLAIVIGLLVPVTGCQEFNSELAPVQDVRFDISDTEPLAAVTVTVQYGLPNGCYSFDRTKVVEITGGWDIGIWIKIPANAEACTEIYGMGETTVDLGKKFEQGQSYTIRINGSDRTINIPTQGAVEDLIIKPAPIVSASVRIAESFPPQVFVDIRGILTDGCTFLHETVVQLQGNIIDITVNTQWPKDAVCIQVISFFDTVVSLGSDFISGQQYTLRVNGKSQFFSVDSGVVPPPDTAPTPGTIVPPVTRTLPATAPPVDLPTSAHGGSGGGSTGSGGIPSPPPTTK